MVYPYNVNYNGKLYVAGQDVPTEEQAKLNLDTEIKEEVAEVTEEVVETKKKGGRKAK